MTTNGLFTKDHGIVSYDLKAPTAGRNEGNGCNGWGIVVE